MDLHGLRSDLGSARADRDELERRVSASKAQIVAGREKILHYRDAEVVDHYDQKALISRYAAYENSVKLLSLLDSDDSLRRLHETARRPVEYIRTLREQSTHACHEGNESNLYARISSRLLICLCRLLMFELYFRRFSQRWNR